MDTSSPDNRHVTVIDGVTHRVSGAGTACGARVGVVRVAGDVDCMACIADNQDVELRDFQRWHDARIMTALGFTNE